jgi:hypothetical protein
MTVEQLISDIENQLLQGSPSDDSELSWDQLKFWATYHLNSLVATECNEKAKRGESIPSIYVRHKDCEVMSVEQGEFDTKLYIELPEKTLELNNDRGILLVQTEDGEEILRTSVEDMVRTGKMRFAKPSIQNPLFYRRSEKLFLLGFNEVDIPFEKISVYYIPEQDLLTAEDTDDVLVSDMALPILIDTVVQRGKQQLYGTQPDQANDGVDNKQVQYHTAVRRPESDDNQQIANQ